MEVLVKFIVTLLITILIGLLMSLPIMWIWNWLMPDIFGLTTITFVQAIGLSLLSNLLLKSQSSGNN